MNDNLIPEMISIQKGVEHANKHDYKNKYYHIIADPSKFRDNGYQIQRI